MNWRKEETLKQHREDNNRAVRILEHARFYLAKLPLEDQNMIVDPVTNWIINPAIPILFNIECGLKFYEGAHS